MTKQIFADGVASVIPVLGAVQSGSLTYAIFNPRCMKLRKNLMSYNLCEPDFYKNMEENDITDVELVEVDINEADKQ